MIPGIDIFTGLYLTAYAAMGALFPLIGQYLSSIGFSGGEIGLVSASATATGIFANPIWGSVYHKHGRSKKLIVFLCFITALLSLSLLSTKQFAFFLMLYVLVFFFENSIFPLIDATTLESNYPFGSARKWGAIGYAAGIGVTGLVADRLGLSSIIPIFSGLFVVAGLMMIVFIRLRRNLPSYEHRPGQAEPADEILERHEGKGYLDLLHNKRYVAFLVAAFFINGPSFSHNTYFSFLYKDQGGTIAGMGLALLLMAVSEAPFMAWAEKLATRFSLQRMLFLAMSVSVVRFLWYSTGPEPAWIMATFFLQGFVNGIFLVESVKYVAKLVGQDMVSLGIPLYTALSANLGTITCQLAGGIIMDYYGGNGVYFFYGLFNLVGIAVYLLFGLHKKSIGEPLKSSKNI